MVNEGGSSASAPQGRGAEGRGLGKGLAGILGDAMAARPSPEVASLLGQHAARRAPEVRRLVIDLAVEALSHSFGALGVLLARRETDGDHRIELASTMPARWSLDEPTGFEIVGRLWGLIDRHGDDEVVDVDDVSGLFTSAEVGTSRLAAALVRAVPFDDDERRVIGRLLNSVARAFDPSDALPEGAALRVLVRPSAEGSLADVRLSNHRGRRHAGSVAATAERAVAQAAAELCDLALRVRFAGTTTVGDNLVTVVVVEEADGGPLFGLAVTDRSSASGPAEATFAAAASIGAAPYPLSSTH